MRLLDLLCVIGAATAQPYTAAQHQLNHIPPRDFEDSISSFPAVLILFCQTSQASCNRLERNLANAAVKLAAERSAASIHMVDTSEWGGEALRLRYGADQKGLVPELIVFRSGLSTVYHGKRDADAVYEHMSAAGKGKPAPKRDSKPRSADAPDDEEEGVWLRDQPTDRVLSLSSANFSEALNNYPLLFVLFYSAEKQQKTSYLHANFSAAAVSLHEQRISCRLAKMEIRRDWPESVSIAQRLQVSELPDIRIFRFARGSEYQAGASTLDIVDVARWNAGNLLTTGGLRGRSAVHEVEATSGFEQLLAKHRLVLLAFTTRWCARCLMLQTEFDAASLLLASAEPPIALASINLDNPRNRALIERFGVLSFPIGKIFHRGRLVGDFMGGSLAHEIVTEMLTIRDELRQAEAATEAEQKQQQSSTSKPQEEAAAAKESKDEL